MKFEELEEIRTKYCKKRRKFSLIVAAVVLVIVLIFAVPAFTNGDSADAISTIIPAAIIGAIVGAVIVSFATSKDAKAYKKAYKSYFVETTMRKYFTDLSYNHEAGLAREVLKNTGMITTGDIYHSNDFTSGKYHEVPFSQADVEIQDEYTDSDGNTHITTLFKGRWMIFEFPKKFNFRIAIKGKRGGQILSLSKRFGKNARKFKKAEVESTEFNKMFKLYSEDGFETFYLLDPAFIKNLEDLGTETNGRILLCFVDNRLHIGINNYMDSFEPPKASRRIDEQAEFAKVEKDIKLITNFVDQLKLDHRLFS